MAKRPPRVESPTGLQVFVGSSSEASGVADAVSEELPRAAKRHKTLEGLRVKPWDLAAPETTILATLEQATSDSDFAIFIFAGDDEILSRGNRPDDAAGQRPLRARPLHRSSRLE
jgi:predicted nucleotide-binding protein